MVFVGCFISIELICNTWEKFLLTRERGFSKMAVNDFAIYLALNLFIDCKLK